MTPSVVARESAPTAARGEASHERRGPEPLRFYVDAATDSRHDPATLTPLLQEAMCGTDLGLSPCMPERVSDPGEADVWALPRVWGYYIRSERRGELFAIAERAAAVGKPVLVWHTGDLTPIVPFANCIVLTNALDRSTRPSNWHAAPRFIDDPLARYASGQLAIRPKGRIPRIGFCGYANAAAWKVAYSVLHGLHFRVNALGRQSATPYSFEPPPLLPAAVLRARVLDALGRHSRVDANFVVRSKYRAGAREAGADHPTVREFFDNVLGSDYTVCVRGYGNWSIRLYETLACGRIPVLIDTNCVLPFDDIVDWRRYCVWVPSDDVARAGDYVADFHDRLSADQFLALQHECRGLWETRLTRSGFLSHLREYLVSH
jgi:hypothetical protein